MKRCTKAAFDNCPHEERCKSLEEAFFMSGSECEKFNNEVTEKRGNKNENESKA